MAKPVQKVNPERKRTRFNKEFKLEAVRLLELGQKPAAQLALELGIARNQLCNRPPRQHLERDRFDHDRSRERHTDRRTRQGGPEHVSVRPALPSAGSHSGRWRLAAEQGRVGESPTSYE